MNTIISRNTINKWIAPVRFIISLIFTGLLIIFCDAFGIFDLPYRSVFNIGSDILGMGVCTALLFSLMHDKDGVSEYTRPFVLLISSVSIVIFTDACCWLVDEEPDLRILNIAVNIGNYISATSIIYYLWQYMVGALQLKGILDRPATVFMKVMLIISLIACLSNIFFPLYFTIDANGTYQREPLFFMSQLYPAVGIILVIIGLFTSKVPVRERLILGVFIFIPLSCLFITGFEYGYSAQYTSLLVSIVLVYGVIVAKRENKLVSTEKELYEAKVSVMVSQVQPHFMYNALTSIAMMCTIDPPTAQEATITFAKYLRTNMDSLRQTAPVPFEQELEHLKKYLYIEKLRFADKLDIVYDITVTDFVLPLLSIQPIVENAVKHGVGMKKKGGTVTIATRETDTAYEVIISDDGIGFDTSAPAKDDGRSHIGMENTRTRLKEMCAGEIRTKSTVGEGTVVTIILPKESQKRGDAVS